MNFDKYNIKTYQDLMKFFKKHMNYGFVYRNKIFTQDNPNFQEEMNKFYKLRLKDDFIKSGYGVCWDFCELEREFFLSKNIPHECYFVESFVNRSQGGPTHSFLLFKENNNWFWFEFSWGDQRGIKKYNSKEAALEDVLSKHKKFCEQIGHVSKVRLYKIDKFDKRLNAFEYVEKCINSKQIQNIKGL